MACLQAGLGLPPTLTPTTVRLPPRPITPSSLEVVRRNFEVSASKGFLKHPVLHVEFNPPRNCKECCCCSAMDFLYVYVGLCNVFLLQFVMVVLWFFSQSEVNLSDLGTWTTWVTIQNGFFSNVLIYVILIVRKKIASLFL